MFGLKTLIAGNPLHSGKSKQPVWGLMAEYDDEHHLVDAIKKMRAEGYRTLEAYTPYPSHHVIHALGHKSYLAQLIFCGACTGALTGFGMQSFANLVHYPINIGGRPDYSWPSFIIITFEMTILFSAFTAVFGMLLLNGLPRPHHPVFSVPQFERASQDRFFLVVHSSDPKFHAEGTRSFLDGLSPLSVAEVPNE